MSMNTTKYKVHEVAKDLNVTNKDVLDLLEEKLGQPKKHMTALTTEELDIILEYFSQQNQVQNFDAYFASGEEEKKRKEEELARQKQEQEEQEAARKREEERLAQKKKEEEVQKAQEAAQKKVQEEQRAAQKQVESAPQRNKDHGERNGRNDRRERKEPVGARPNSSNRTPETPKRPQQGQPAQRPQGDKNANRNQNNNRQSGQAVQSAQQSGRQVPAQQPKPKGERVVRTVDTRGSYIELDKYNERYEEIAPQNKKMQDVAKKQKINQKSAQRGKQQYSNKKETERDKLKRLELERARKQQLKVLIPDEIVVSELAARLKVTSATVIKKLIPLGVMAGINETIDFDTASLVAIELGAKVEKEVVVTIEERLFDESDDTDDNLVERSPVVVVMGHVDHGKTSLLDYIRKANVTASEAGGITQHIGAYRVNAGGKTITFLDTPGHEAFTAMRARGAMVTDIAILVVAADDGIMPQTVEAINHAKAAGVSIIVAINKIDKPTANPDKVKQELTEYDLVPEEWGGDVVCVPVSALTGEGVDTLLEMVGLVADMRELKANPDRLAKGTVIEARLDKGRGPVASLLVQNGTLHVGDALIAGMTVGRVRVMLNDKGESIQEAGPSVPVEITGLTEVPSAGDVFNAVEDERLARELVEQRKHEAKEEQFKSYQKVTLDNLFSQIAQGEMKELPIIVKADVQGSVEAVKQSLEKLSNDEVRVRVIHGAVGAISESDVMLADVSNAIIVGFNVRPDPVARDKAEADEVEMRMYRIIYDAIDDVKQAMKGLLAPKTREVEHGRIEVRQVYKITNVGTVAGCYVLEGKVTRSSRIRIVRDGIVVADDGIKSLKRFKDDVKEVAQGYECGITLEKYGDIKEGDIYEAFEIEEYRD